MLKIRLQGTVRDIRWFKRILEKNPEIRVLQTSEIFPIRGQTDIFALMQKLREQKRKKGR